MWKLVQSGLSVVAGTAEPEYGPDSIHPVGSDVDTTKEKIYKNLAIDDLKYISPNHTNVETQTFYFQDNKYAGFAQVIHSNVIGLRTTAQFTFKLFEKSTPQDFIWTSTKLENFKIENGTDFIADNLSIVLNKDKINSYKIDSSVNKLTEVHLTVERIGDGVKFGHDGTTYYGTDVENPWGSMRHIFWPRCKVDGDIILRELKPDQDLDNLDEEEYEYIVKDEVKIENGLTMYVMALQGMKPHHAAATWEFLNYQSDNYSVVIMEFTTPPSYNKTKVSVSMVVDKNGKILLGSMKNETKHLEKKIDEVSGWNIPTKISYTIDDEDNGSKFNVEIVGELKSLCERVDVMAEIPQFVKNIASGVAGTKPYIFQFSNTMELTIKKDGEVIATDSGYAYSESTFITAI